MITLFYIPTPLESYLGNSDDIVGAGLARPWNCQESAFGRGFVLRNGANVVVCLSTSQLGAAVGGHCLSSSFSSP